MNPNLEPNQEAASAPEPSIVAETVAREKQQEKPEASDSFGRRRRTSKEYVEMVEAGETSAAEGRVGAVGVPPEASREAGKESGAPPRLFVRRQLLSLLRRPPVVGLFIGLLVGLVSPLQRVLFERGAPLAPIGQALSTLSEGTVPVMRPNPYPQ